MKITVSAMKADVGSIGGHSAPSPALMETVGTYVRKGGGSLLLDVAVEERPAEPLPFFAADKTSTVRARRFRCQDRFSSWKCPWSR